MTTIKICGITRAEDADVAVALGVHALGFVLWPNSPRHVSVARAAAIVRTLPPLVASVGVFVDPTRDELARALDEGGFSALQVHGHAAAWEAVRGLAPRMIRAVRLGDAAGAIEPPVDAGTAVLIDAHDPVRIGGSGQIIDWARAATVAAQRRVILAGGLTPDNVAEAVRVVRPYGVDVASGVEQQPGLKDAAKVRAFVQGVRDASQPRDRGPKE